MSFLKKLFGKKDTADRDPALQQQFDAEWFAAKERFGHVIGVPDFTLELKHPQTQQEMFPHEGLAGSFGEWLKIQSAYDRRRLFFDLLYGTTQSALTAWHTANYLVAVRQPDKALAELESAPPPTPEQPGYAEHCAAFAKANLKLTRYDIAQGWAEKAVVANPESSHFQTVLADCLHLGGECERAHEIYSRLMSSAPPAQSEPAGAVAEMFRLLFARETGVVSSPVLALEIGESLRDPSQSEEFWQRSEVEFYDSPYFRMQHAYHLAKQGETERSFAKLLTLVQEMPWLKEASLNLVSYFEHYDPTGRKIMPEFQSQLRERIQTEGWTVEGMRSVATL